MDCTHPTIYIKMSDFDSCLKPTLYRKNGELEESKPDISGIEIGQNGHFRITTHILTEVSQSQTYRQNSPYSPAKP